MFVRSKKYNSVLAQAANREIDYMTLKLKYQTLLHEWNELIDTINEKGGDAFLNSESSEFTQEEIKKLLMLCHPDKHGGKPMAQEMTQKLLRLKK